MVGNALPDLKGTGIIAHFLVGKAHGIGGIQPLRLHFQRPFPVGKRLIIALHGPEQVTGIDVQESVLREFPCRLFRPAQSLFVFLRELECLDQADPVLEFCAAGLHAGEKFIDIFLIPPHLPEEIALLPPDLPVDLPGLLRALFQDPLKDLLRLFHADIHHLLVQDAVEPQVLVRIFPGTKQLFVLLIRPEEILRLFCGLEHTAQPLGIVIVGHGGLPVQVINGNAVEPGDGRQYGHIGKRRAALPPGYALGADTQVFCRLLLGISLGKTQTLEVFTKCSHIYFPFQVLEASDYIIINSRRKSISRFMMGLSFFDVLYCAGRCAAGKDSGGQSRTRCFLQNGINSFHSCGKADLRVYIPSVMRYIGFDSHGRRAA